MKRFSIGALCAISVLVFALAGCAQGASSSASAPEQSVDKSALRGFWELDKDAEMGFTAALNLDEEGYAELLIADSYLEGTWKVEGDKATVEFGEETIEVDEGGVVDLGEGVAESAAAANVSAASAESNAASQASDASASADQGATQAADAPASAEEGTAQQSDASNQDSSTKANIYISDGKLVLGKPDGAKLIFVKGNMDAYFDEENAVQVGEIEGSASVDDPEVVMQKEEINDVTPVKAADGKACSIEVTGKGTDGAGDPGYRVNITNKTNKEIIVESDEMFKVNGNDIEAGLGEIVEPGGTLESFMYFVFDEENSSADSLKNVSGTVFVKDENDKQIEKIQFKMD